MICISSHLPGVVLSKMIMLHLARYTPRFKLPKAFLDRKASRIQDSMPTDSTHTDSASEAVNLDSAEGLEHAMTLAFPNIHRRAYTSTDFSYPDGSAKKVDGSPKRNQNGQEVAGTYTGQA